MKKEELKQKAEEYALEKCKECYMCNSEENGERGYCPKLESRKEGYIAGAEPREKRIAELEAQIEKMKKYGKLLLDICDVMGNDPYMVWRGLEQRVLILWDKSEEEKGLKMADDILERLLKISAIDWAEIEKWEIKEK